MGTKEKLVERFKKLPKDFTYEETLKLLFIFGYYEHNKGATLGGLGCDLKMNKQGSISIFINHIRVV